MCGIGGIIKLNGNIPSNIATNLSIKLLNKLQSRGKDATGIALVNLNKKSYDYRIMKLGITAKKFTKTNKLRGIFKNKFNIVLLHTRHATHGDYNKNVNNHPHYNKDTENILIHNGVISNYESLKTSEKLNLDSNCDSEIILKLADKIGFKKAIEKLIGSMGIAITDMKNKKLIVFKNASQTLHMAYLKNEDIFVFASTENILRDVLNSCKIKFGKLVFQNHGNVYERYFEDDEMITFDFKKRKIYSEIIKTKERIYYNYSRFNDDDDNDDDDTRYKGGKNFWKQFS